MPSPWAVGARRDETTRERDSTFPPFGLTLPGVFVPRRLDKYLRDSTPLPLKSIREACLFGRVIVWVEGQPQVTHADPDRLVFEDDVVRLDGAPLQSKKELKYLVFNKPRHVTVTHCDPKGHGDLARYLETMPEGVFAVGRMDRDTTGALLLTNDGDFASAILRPDRHTEKEYWLWLDDCLTDDDPRLCAFVSGVPRGGALLPLRVTHCEILCRTSDYTELSVTLHEGKNRHLRKMCNLLRLELVHLHRKRVANITVEGLPLGSFRPLTAEELDQLWRVLRGPTSTVGHKVAALRRQAHAARARGEPDERLESWLEAAAQAWPHSGTTEHGYSAGKR